ncbi:MAG: pitrilysin family protein [Leeuwenhoekiella sp.]
MKNIFLSILFICSLGATAQIDRSKQPQPGPAPEIKINKPQTFTLKNGLKVIVVENHKLPRVTYNLTIDNPPVLEGDKIGESSLTGSMLGKGSQSIAKDDFYEEVDYMGANIQFGAGGAYGNGLSKYSDRILELMADGALHPNFTQEEFDAEKAILTDNIKSAEKDVSTAANQLSALLAYGANHPKGEFETQEKVAKVTLDDVKSYYSKVFIPNNAYLIVVGDVKPKDIEKLAKKYFSDWRKGTPLSNDYPEPKNIDAAEIDFVDMPNAVQSEIIVQNLVTLKMGDKDYFPVLIANQILGGGGEGRLFLNLREDKGYTYGAYSNIGTDKYAPTRFSASASVRNAVTDSSVVAFLDEIKNFRDKLVTEKDLSNAKAKYIGSFVRSLEQPATVANFALNIETQNLPDDFYESYLEKVNAVTLADVQRVAQKYFLADKARIVIAGKGSEVLENLEKVTFNGKSIPVKYFDKEGNAIDKPNYSAAAPEGVTAQSVLENYIKAIGGKEKLEAVKSVSLNAEGEVQGMKLGLMQKKTDSNQLLQTISMNGSVMSKQVLNGETGYVEAQGQTMQLPADQLKALQESSVPFPELQLLSDANIKFERKEAINGADAYAVKTGENKTSFYDINSGFKVKEETTMSANGQTMVQTLEMGDYKDVDGIMFPFTLSQTMGPQKIDFKVIEIKVNDAISAEDFK